MGLNDDTNREFGTTSLEDDLVVPPQSNIEPNGEKLKLVAPGPLSTVKEPTQEFLDKLPEANIQLQAITDKVSKVYDLREIEANIMGLEGICLNDVLCLESYIPDFFTGKVTKNHFSSSCRSQSQREYTKLAIENDIVEKEASIITDLNNVVMPLATGTIQALTIIKEEVVNTHIPVIRGYMYEYNGIVEKLEASKNTLYPINKDFFSVINSDLTTFSFKDISIQNGKELEDYKNIILNCLNTVFRKNVFFSVIDGKPLQEAISPERTCDYQNSVINGKALFSFISSQSLPGYLEDISTSSDNLIVKLTNNCELISKLNEANNISEATRDIIPEIQSTIDLANMYITIVINFRLLTMAIDKLGVVFKKL